jgi:hypothetical protein
MAGIMKDILPGHLQDGIIMPLLLISRLRQEHWPPERMLMQ